MGLRVVLQLLFTLLQYWGVNIEYTAFLQEFKPENLPDHLKPGGYDRCRDNPTCTSLKVIQYVADKHGPQNNLTVQAGENWTLEGIMEQLIEDRPVMVNYGGGRSDTGERQGTGHSFVIYGLNFDTQTIYKVDPLYSESEKSFSEFVPKWENSDYLDPLREDLNYEPYKNWALVMYPNR